MHGYVNDTGLLILSVKTPPVSLVCCTKLSYIFECLQDRDMTCRQSPRGDIFTVGDFKDLDRMDHLPELADNDPAYSSNFEQWDTYWEDLTKYTRLTSCDIWGTKEVDFLGLDDFSSPYQDEEVIGRTPTLAQLNSEDSQPVCDTLYHPDLLVGQKQLLFPPPTVAKKTNKLSSSQPAPHRAATLCRTSPRDPRKLPGLLPPALTQWPRPSFRALAKPRLHFLRTWITFAKLRCASAYHASL